MPCHPAKLMWTGLACVFLGACGTKSFAVKDPLKDPLQAFGRVVVRPFTAEVAADAAPEVQESTKNMALFIAAELEALLSRKKLFDREGPKLVITGRLGTFDPGSQALRYFVGLGAGSGEIIADVTLNDDNGALVASGTARGTISGGLLGGSIESAGRRVARAIYHFLQANYEAIEEPAKPEEPATTGRRR